MQKLFSASIYGVHGNIIEVEVDVIFDAANGHTSVLTNPSFVPPDPY